ncbi:hypothetical protein GOP47_0001949 [Adiantum capillus-veneris]|uniref:Uncharacterized protein n=1 Tax=Adiantum capillus-veneris TaxID=13818 RepID=A0A9D4VAK2_ADICA|nr:hypothetical protein GOP47_0001949 [Adiantum capillus-veneris]
MSQCPNEENAARKLEVAITRRTHVLHQSKRHNVKTSISSNGGYFAKAQSMAKKTDRVCSLKQVGDIHAKHPAASFGSHKEEHAQLGSASKTTVKVQDSTNASEIHELKRRLQTANLQIAEVVAQSAILVRDVECAASKKISDALRNVQVAEVKQGSSLLANMQIKRGFDHVGASTAEQELAATRQELAECKCMLAVMRRQLDRTSREKEKLETYLRSSVETSLKLESSLGNQKAVTQLELLAAEDRCRNESAGSVQSARNETKHLQEQLEAAMLSKAESDFLLRDCIQILCHAQRELLQYKAPSKWQCSFQTVVQEKSQQLQELAQEQAQIHRENLHEAAAENAIIWTVLECMWEGAVQSSLESQSLFDVHDGTPKLSGKYARQLRSRVQECFCSSEEDPTPLKSRTLLETPRLTNVVGYRVPTFGVSHPEDILRQSLMKSEQEVEILGDKVDELRIILEKITLLLDCISKSSVTGHETRVLMRRIIEQLQTFES